MDEQGVLRVLKGTEAWLSDPEHWCSWHLYESSYVPRKPGQSSLDYMTEILQSGQFDRTCALGSIMHHCGVNPFAQQHSCRTIDLYQDTLRYLNPYLTHLGFASIPMVNDCDEGYSVIMSLLREAINDLEASSPAISLPSGQKVDQSDLINV